MRRVRIDRRSRPETRSSRGAPTTSALPFGPPPILEGEDAAAYEDLFSRITSAVKPRDILEEIFIRDIADLQWDVLRYRRLKIHFISSDVSERLSALLRGEFDFLGERDGEASEGEPAKECEGEDEETSAESPAEEEHPADKLVRRWTGREPDALEEVDHLLMSANVTMDVAIQPAVFENLDMIERIEHLIEIAEARRNSALHELDRHRSTLAKVVRGTIQHIEEDEPPVVAPKTIERIRSQR